MLSLEDDPVPTFTSAFEGVQTVYFAAGAGGKGGEERTKKVDYEGAVKVFDAIEGVKGLKPRLILVSAIDVRDLEKVPPHYVSQLFHKVSSAIQHTGVILFLHHIERRRHRSLKESTCSDRDLLSLEVRGR